MSEYVIYLFNFQKHMKMKVISGVHVKEFSMMVPENLELGMSYEIFDPNEFNSERSVCYLMSKTVLMSSFIEETQYFS